MRIPRVIDINAWVQAPDIGQLSDEERQSIKEFSDRFLELIEMSEVEDGIFQAANGQGRKE